MVFNLNSNNPSLIMRKESLKTFEIPGSKVPNDFSNLELDLTVEHPSTRIPTSENSDVKTSLRKANIAKISCLVEDIFGSQCSHIGQKISPKFYFYLFSDNKIFKVVSYQVFFILFKENVSFWQLKDQIAFHNRELASKITESDINEAKEIKVVLQIVWEDLAHYFVKTACCEHLGSKISTFGSSITLKKEQTLERDLFNEMQKALGPYSIPTAHLPSWTMEIESRTINFKNS